MQPAAHFGFKMICTAWMLNDILYKFNMLQFKQYKAR